MSSQPLVLVLSDLHIGKLTQYGYCQDVAAERIAEIPGRVDKAAGLRGRGQVVVLLLGDLVDGETTWATQAAEVEYGLTDQVGACHTMLWSMLEDIHRRSRGLVSVISVPGNHGRIPMTSPNTNADRETVDRLAQHRDRWLTVRSHKEYLRVAEIGRWRYVLIHKGPKHVRTPAMEVKALRWMRAHKAACVVGGHWHRAEVVPVSGDGWIVTGGSLSGPDTFSESLALYDPARQVWFEPGELSPVERHGYIEWPTPTLA
jgi:predicted phosphodiesterase